MKKIHFSTYLDIIECDLILRRHANQDDRWLAQIEHCDVKEDGVLAGSYGDGKTPEEAIMDYIDQIEGKCIAINAYTDKRREYNVPVSIFY